LITTSKERAEKLIRDARDLLIDGGLPSSLVDPPLSHVETEIMKALTADRIEFLRDLKLSGTAALAEREGLSKSQIRRRKARAVNELARFKTAA